jgi:hypothetical protein
MLVITLSIALAVSVVVTAMLASKNQFFKNELEATNSQIEALQESLEMANAGRQLLRNEVTVLQSQIRVMESKSMHAVVDAPKTEEVKKKKKYFKKKSAPKMSAEKK